MRVLLLPGDRGGCGLYRMIMPGRAVSNAYSDVQAFSADGLYGKSTRDRHGNVTVWELPPIDADVVVFQRPLNDELAACIPAVQKQGVAVVVELDDDFEKVHPLNASASAVNPELSPKSNWRFIYQACEMADLVTVSTQRLTRYANHDRVRVVNNYLPRSICDIELPAHTDDRPVRVGWTGTVATHPQDLTVTRGAVADLLEDHRDDVELVVVGGGQGVFEELLLRPGQEDFKRTGWVPLPQYPETVRDNIDVGLVPLMDIPFNHAKSALKGLEFASLGKPFVASPTAEYLRLNKAGVGLIARGRKDWAKHLERLVKSAALRQEIGEAGREIVRQHFTIEQHAHEWYDAWNDAMTYRDRRVGNGVAHAAVG